MGELLELSNPTCPRCGNDTLVLGIMMDKPTGLCVDIKEINVYCTSGKCDFDKVIANRKE